MSADSQPENHPVLLVIAAAAFVVLMALGVGLSGSTSGHVTGGHAVKEATGSAH